MNFWYGACILLVRITFSGHLRADAKHPPLRSAPTHTCRSSHRPSRRGRITSSQPQLVPSSSYHPLILSSFYLFDGLKPFHLQINSQFFYIVWSTSQSPLRLIISFHFSPHRGSSPHASVASATIRLVSRFFLSENLPDFNAPRLVSC